MQIDINYRFNLTGNIADLCTTIVILLQRLVCTQGELLQIFSGADIPNKIRFL